jgi:hypothetical protein
MEIVKAASGALMKSEKVDEYLQDFMEAQNEEEEATE